MANLRDYLFYEEAGIQLYCGDCREVLPLLGGKFDVVIADPPYGDTSLTWDVPVGGWLPLLRTSISPEGSLWCFGSLRFFMRSRFDGWRVSQDIVWEKHNGSSFHTDRFRRVHEHVVHFYPEDQQWAKVYRKPVYTHDGTARTIRRKQRPPHMGHIEAGHYVSEDGGPRLMRSVICVRSEHGCAEHPTQKPLGIIRPLIAYSCPPNGTILDPFAGAGSALVVAYEMARSAIGIEISPEYCTIAVKRLRQEVLPL